MMIIFIIIIIESLTVFRCGGKKKLWLGFMDYQPLLVI